MQFTVTTHLNFRGQAKAALDFYHAVFGGEQTVMTYGAMGQAEIAMAPEHVIWGQVAAADGFRIMAFDVQAGREYDPGTNAFFISLRGDSDAGIKARWAALAQGGTILQPLAASPWSPLYGMLTDRFGITWILDLDASAH